MVAKLSQLSDSGEGISVPSTASQVAFPNDGIALYGPYNGTLGGNGGRYRLRLFYSGGKAAQQLLKTWRSEQKLKFTGGVRDHWGAGGQGCNASKHPLHSHSALSPCHSPKVMLICH